MEKTKYQQRLQALLEDCRAIAQQQGQATPASGTPKPPISAATGLRLRSDNHDSDSN